MGFDNFLLEPPRKTGCCFANGSTVEVLTQSQTSVRGQHIQKLRCDEVELFKPEIFNAAKFATQSKYNIIAGLEVISTMHRPYGLMQQIVADAEKNNTPVFKWCIWETIEKCQGRNCSQCPLWTDCAGRAKKAEGFLKIDDCITQMQRSSRAGWESEMLCLKPNLENAVFDQFKPGIHVKAVEYDPNLPLYRSFDFGFVNPFVCLWIQVDKNGIIRVIDEYIRTKTTIEAHAAEIKSRDKGNVITSFCDPSGAALNSSGTSIVRQMRDMGINLRYRASVIADGIELIRRAICDGTGKSRLIISPKCPGLIKAMDCYHYPDKPQEKELPVKDGTHDHPIDALRYFFINYETTSKTGHRVF